MTPDLYEWLGNHDFVINTPMPPDNPAPERHENTLTPEEQAELWKKEKGHFGMGTSVYWDHPDSDWKYTDGIKRVAEIFNAWWLVDELCSHPEGEGRGSFHTGSIQFAKITSCKNNSVLEYYDDSSEENCDRVVTWLSPYGEKQEERPNFITLFPNNSLPIEEIVICRQGDVIYLLMEH
jgi:hypothetical protein